MMDGCFLIDIRLLHLFQGHLEPNTDAQSLFPTPHHYPFNADEIPLMVFNSS